MTASDIADHVVIRCPHCGARETAGPETLADAPTIVCRECGETWPAAPLRKKLRIDLVSQTKARMRSNAVEAQRRPLVTYSDDSDSAWAAKAEGDTWPESPRQWRFPMIAGAFTACLFLLAFFGLREETVQAVPDLAGLYAAIGLPVNLEGIAIEDVAADLTSGASGERIVVRGVIRNLTDQTMPVRPLAATLYASGGAAAVAQSFEPPARKIGAGETTPFLITFDRAPAGATEVAVRFRRPGETLPVAAGAAQSVVR